MLFNLANMIRIPICGLEVHMIEMTSQVKVTNTSLGKVGIDSRLDPLLFTRPAYRLSPSQGSFSLKLNDFIPVCRALTGVLGVMQKRWSNH